MLIYLFGRIVVLEDRIEWTIKNFLRQPMQKPWKIMSTIFNFKRDQYRLEICLRRNMEQAFEKYLVVSLISLSLEDFSRYSVNFSIRKKSGHETESSTAHYNNDSVMFLNDEFLLRETLVLEKDELLPNGHLTIVCYIHKEGEEPSEVKSRLDEAAQDSVHQRKCDAAVQTIEDATMSSVTSAFKDAVSFRDGCKAMYQSGEFFDFDVKVQDRIFRTHKLVLAARSPAFASMLRHDMQEKNTGMVEIVDCNPETFEAFLKFLYDGENDVIIPENVVGLFEVANKYEILNLKAECLRFMMTNLSIELFCDVMCLAWKHEERELIKHAIEYFKLNKNIFLSVQWEIFLKEDFRSANELLIKSCD